MFCPNCGHQVSAEAGFCGHCGARLEQPSSAPQTSRQRALKALGVYLLVVLLLGAAAVWVFLRPGDEPPSSGVNEEEDAAVAAPMATATLTPSLTPVGVESESEATMTSTLLPPVTPTSTVTPTASPTPLATQTSQPTFTSVPTLMPSPSPDPGPETLVIGRSVNESPIEAVRFGNGPQAIVFIGGLHAGFAPATVTLAQRAVEHFTQNPELIPDSLTVYVIISANPDSPHVPGELDGRLNTNSVDLNRNWDCDWVRDARWRSNVVPGSGGPEPFSEPETQALRDFILEKRPVSVIFWEARAENGLVSPGNCGARSQASETLATKYGQAAGYQISDFEALTNQVLNGDAANWLDQQGVPAIAVLLPQYTSVDWENNLKGILAILQ